MGLIVGFMIGAIVWRNLEPQDRVSKKGKEFTPIGGVSMVIMDPIFGTIGGGFWGRGGLLKSLEYR